MSTQPAGALLGRYHVGVPLGGGPTGEVFRAKLVGVAGFEPEFALKKFHAVLLANASARDALGLAAKSYATLQHPRIARMHEYGTSDGVTFAAVELVRGIDLARLLAA